MLCGYKCVLFVLLCELLYFHLIICLRRSNVRGRYSLVGAEQEPVSMTDKITNTPSVKRHIIKGIFQILLIINITINTSGVSKGHRTLYCNYSCVCWCVVEGTNEK